MNSRTIGRVVGALVLLAFLFALQTLYGQMSTLQHARKADSKKKETVIYQMGPDVRLMLEAQARGERELEEARVLAEERRKKAVAEKLAAEEKSNSKDADAPSLLVNPEATSEDGTESPGQDLKDPVVKSP